MSLKLDINDTLVFYQATREAVLCIKAVLQILEEVSGLKMNMGKSVVVFRKNNLVQVRSELALILGVPVVPKHAKYLGLPSIVGQSNRAVIDSIKDRIWRKMPCWLAKKLSQVSRVVMIKSVLQAIPTYAEGCLGVRSLKEFNIALLCKQEWRIGVDTNNLIHRLFKAKHFLACSFVDAAGRGNNSCALRPGILAVRPVLKAEIHWHVGNGKSIPLAATSWLPRLSTFKLLDPPHSLRENALVGELFNPAGVWD
ncbi:UNVERIFIED_CONTAM: hypothetical protein Slati_1937100 [Sesamum latifolium]|uniref:Reverse transcriptase n=1 Tax=Sesamum latifolium TaxID=2727402 RepID=A0AAW2X1J7_9LAMI